MIGKDDILELLHKEIDICVHLFGKLPEGGLDFRPTPEQRSTRELLRYLSHCAIGGTRALVEGGWDGYREEAEQAAKLRVEEFPKAMEQQRQRLSDYFGKLTQEQLDTRTATTPIGEQLPLDQALVRMPVAWMTAYRMQLFLYAKQAGNTELWTPNCWAGIDMERPAPQTAKA